MEAAKRTGVMYRLRSGGESYWFVVDGDERAARAEFDRINTVTVAEAPYLPHPVSRGMYLVSIYPVETVAA